MIVKSLKDKTLLASMAYAVIVAITKPGKDPELCVSYLPISLLNADAKILTKTLAMRLNQVIQTLVHEDQTGFMPGKGTDINLWRLYTVLGFVDCLTQSAAVAFLDAEKSFDSVE